MVAFDFTVNRHRDGPDEVLADFERNCRSAFHDQVTKLESLIRIDKYRREECLQDADRNRPRRALKRLLKKSARQPVGSVNFRG